MKFDIALHPGLKCGHATPGTHLEVQHNDSAVGDYLAGCRSTGSAGADNHFAVCEPSSKILEGAGRLFELEHSVDNGAQCVPGNCAVHLLEVIAATDPY